MMRSAKPSQRVLTLDGREGGGELARNHGTEELATLGVEVSGVAAGRTLGSAGLLFSKAWAWSSSHGIEGGVGLGVEVEHNGVGLLADGAHGGGIVLQACHGRACRPCTGVAAAG